MPGTHRINLEDFDATRYPGDWVDIHDTLSLAQKTRMDNAGITARPTGEGGEIVFEAVDVSANVIETLATAVIAWSLAMPPTRDGFLSDELPSDLGEWLLAQVRAHYAAQGRSNTEGKSSAARSTAPSSKPRGKGSRAR